MGKAVLFYHEKIVMISSDWLRSANNWHCYCMVKSFTESKLLVKAHEPQTKSRLSLYEWPETQKIYERGSDSLNKWIKVVEES